MKFKKKILFFVALMSLLYCVNLIQGTYAKYISSATANADITIARWNILVNTQDIVANSNFTNRISPQFTGTSNIKPGVIAPTAEGTFIISIDGAQTDVSFEYTLDVDLASDNTVDDLEIVKYEIDGVEYNYSGSISNTILLNDYIRSNNITFYIRWKDGTGETMDNDADTAALVNGVAAFDVSLNVVQVQ